MYHNIFLKSVVLVLPALRSLREERVIHSIFAINVLRAKIEIRTTNVSLTDSKTIDILILKVNEV